MLVKADISPTLLHRFATLPPTHILLLLPVVTVRLVLAVLFVQRLRRNSRQRDPLVRRAEQDVKVGDPGIREDGRERLSGPRDERARVQEASVEKVGRLSAS